jgi:hypothetical protein
MKVNWTFLLRILLVIFGILYIIGTFFGNFNNETKTLIEPSIDLWANLFATMIVVLLIDFIINCLLLKILFLFDQTNLIHVYSKKKVRTAFAAPQLKTRVLVVLNQKLWSVIFSLVVLETFSTILSPTQLGT